MARSTRGISTNATKRSAVTGRYVSRPAATVVLKTPQQVARYDKLKARVDAELDRRGMRSSA